MVEFKSRAAIEQSRPKGAGLDRLQDGGVWNLTAGQPTDDSEMALALARSIVAEGGYVERSAIAAYLRWDASNPFDMGGTTRKAMMALSVGRYPQTSDSQANGALMRASPIGIAFAGDPKAAAEVARQDARLTHSSPICADANAAYCAAIAAGIAGGTAEEMIDAAVGVVHYGSEVAGWLKDAVAGRFPLDYSRQMGWVQIAFINAFGLLDDEISLEGGVIGTVRLGGDTDTNAAIAGALLGASQGMSAVPGQWAEAICACKPDSRSRKPRPMTYWPNDAAFLAEQLLELSPLAWKPSSPACSSLEVARKTPE